MGGPYRCDSRNRLRLERRFSTAFPIPFNFDAALKGRSSTTHESLLASLRNRRQLADGADERGGGTSKRAVAAIGDTQLTPQFFAFNRDELYASGEHLIAGKAGADN